MAKYSQQFKIKVVKEYLNGKMGYKLLARKHNISSASEIRQWVSVYKELGEEGLKRIRKNAIYSFEFKKSMVELYEKTEMSYKAIALANGIANPAIIANWISRYRAVGIDGLLPQKRGRLPTMEKNDQKQFSPRSTQESLSTDETASKLAILQQENLKLRIENAFLKELRRLRLEEEKLQKKSQESSTASEENSN